MKQFETKVYNYIKNHKMIDEGDALVLGLSGGADSVCLLTVLCQLAEELKLRKDHIRAIHVNHGIRGDEARRDARFSRELCDKLHIRFVEVDTDIYVYAKEAGMSLEEAGRSFRYACFQEQLRQTFLSSGKIAVAHNKNDLAETVLFHMMRGSGLKGLSGIRPVRDNVIRPLLGVSRQEIEDYLREIGQGFCADTTNQSLDYDRNRIRHQILPVMQEMNEQAVDHICACAEEAGRSYDFIHKQARSMYGECIDNNRWTDSEKKGFDKREPKALTEKQITLSIEKLVKSGQVMQEHVIQDALSQVAGQNKDITRKHILAVANLMYQKTGNSVQLPYGMIARRSYDVLVVSNRLVSELEYVIDITPGNEYSVANLGKLSVTEKAWDASCKIPKNDYTKILDYGKIKDDLCVRTPEENDYIVINCEGDTKKLNRVFIDGKIDREARKNWPVLACGNEVIWAIGLRYSVAYNVDEETKRVLCLEYRREGEEYGTKDRGYD